MAHVETSSPNLQVEQVAPPWIEVSPQHPRNLSQLWDGFCILRMAWDLEASSYIKISQHLCTPRMSVFKSMGPKS
jgi:hypothetical protein